MLDVLKFIFNCVLQFIEMLFTIDVGFTNLGALMCIVYIFLPCVLIIVNFFKKEFIDELDDYYDNKVDKTYYGKHEYAGKHSKEHFRRERIKESWNK